MSARDPGQTPPRKPRSLGRLIVCALGLAANLYLLSIEIRGIMAGGEITLWTLFATVMSGIFAAMLYNELGKPKPPPPDPRA